MARTVATARLVLAVFDDIYAELCEYPYRAQRAFEANDPQALPPRRRSPRITLTV